MKFKIVLIALAVSVLSACGSTDAGRAGVGSGSDDYKPSPCACVDLKKGFKTKITL